MQGQLRGQVLLEDVPGCVGVGAFDADLHIESAGAQDRGVDEILAVRCTDDDDVVELFDAVDLGEQLRHDRRLHVR